MRSILIAIMFVLTGMGQAYAGQCYGAYKESKKLEKMVKDVYFVSETDDNWNAFASWKPVKKVTEAEIRRVLKLGSTYEGQAAHFSMESYKEAYKFLRGEVESYSPENYDDPKAQKKLKKLISIISKKFGKNVRLIMFGNGDGDSFFVGNHMIVLIDKKGCVLGLKALTVWT